MSLDSSMTLDVSIQSIAISTNKGIVFAIHQYDFWSNKYTCPVFPKMLLIKLNGFCNAIAGFLTYQYDTECLFLPHIKEQFFLQFTSMLNGLTNEPWLVFLKMLLIEEIASVFTITYCLSYQYDTECQV